MITIIYIVIFIAFLYWLSNKYGYWVNVIAYTIGMGLIYTLFFNFTTFPSLIIAIILRFIIGLIMIKLLDKINDYFQNGAAFLISGIILEYLLSRFVVSVAIVFVSML